MSIILSAGRRETGLSACLAAAQEQASEPYLHVHRPEAVWAELFARADGATRHLSAAAHGHD